MKRLLALLTLSLIAATATYLVAAQPAATNTAGRTAAAASRSAVAFDVSPPLEAMEQFIPDKTIVIHPAAESPADAARRNRRAGHGFGRDSAHAAGRAGRRRRGEGGWACGARGAGLRRFPLLRLRPRSAPRAPQSSRPAQGKRPAIELRASFDALGEGFTGREFPGADNAPEAKAAAAQDAAVSTSAWRLVPTISSKS